MDDQDTCRICSAPAEPDQPLFYPCKCSGTIRYIHQDCLTTWLSHSKKKSCDVCKHPYSFTKVYATNMPDKLPLVLFLRQSLRQLFLTVIFTLRGLLVGVIWLALLPWMTVWTWRMYFMMGDSIAWWISARPGSPSSAVPFHLNISTGNVTNSTAHTSAMTSYYGLTGAPLWRAMSADIFAGQIIASLIVLTFVAVFFLREWIAQNERMGVAEENMGDGPGEVIPAPPPAPQPQPQHIPQPQLVAEPEPTIEQLTLEAEERRRNGKGELRGDDDTEDSDTDGKRWQPRAGNVPGANGAGKQRDFKGKGRAVARAGVTTNSASSLSTRRRRLDSLPKSSRRERRQSLASEEDSWSFVSPASERQYESESPEIIDTATDSDVVAASGSDRGPFQFTFPQVPAGRIPSREGETRWHQLKTRSSFPGASYSLHLDQSSNSPGSGSSTRRGTHLNNPFEKTKPWEKTVGELQASRVSGERNASSSRSMISDLPVPNTSTVESDLGFLVTDLPDKEVTSGIEHPDSAKSTIPDWMKDNRNDIFWPKRSEIDRQSRPYSTVERRHRFSPRRSVPNISPGGSALSSESPNSAVSEGFSFAPANPALAESVFSATTKSPLPFPISPTVRQTLPSNTALKRPVLPPADGASGVLSAEPLLSLRAASKAAKTAATIASREQTPLPSPSLATYRAPEEIDAGPSRPAEYLEKEDTGAMKREHDMYFRMPVGFANKPPLDEGGLQDVHIPLPETDDDDDDDNEDDPDGLRDVDGDRDVDEDGDGDNDADGDGMEDRDGLPPAQEIVVDLVNGQVDDLDPNAEDDLDGALEAVGIRGPIHAVFQNAALIIFVLDATMGVAVWIPFTIGRSTALLSLDPRRFLQVLHFPIKVMRIVTDPVVDSFFYIIRTLTLPLAIRSLRLISTLISSTLGLSHAPPKHDRPLWRHFQDLYGSPASRKPTPLHISCSLLFNRLIPSEDSATMRLAKKYFAPLGKEIRETSRAIQETWVRLALGDSTIDRLFAIGLGYTVVMIGLALYLNILTVGSVKSAGRAVRNAIRQQVIVVKVAVFIIIELVIFPLGCGIMLDVCTLGLLPEALLRSRAAFFRYAPVTATFYHWVIGTMFMYQFAILLAGCRSIMRKGAMWFIKDPQDQNFHPIRDILDRPTLLQLRKLFVSAIMYSVVVACGVGSIVAFCRLGGRAIIPLRWKLRQPLSQIPVDLLFLHLVLPPTLHYFRPKKIIRAATIRWWKFSARKLRLTSYMFGGRHPDEEVTSTKWSWVPPFVKSLDDGKRVRDGCFRRVPATDNVALARDMRGTVDVDEHGNPLDDAGRRLMRIQDAEALKAKRDVAEDYVVVYVPPDFRRRIMFFIFLLWLVSSASLVIALALPIRLGRAFFNLFVNGDVHDGYSFVIGFYLLWGCCLVGYTVDRMDKRRQRRGNEGPRPAWAVYLAKRVLLWMAKLSWMLLFLGVIIPTLVALVMEAYIVLPIRFALKPDVIPRVYIVESWAIGLLYTKMLVKMRRIHGPSLITRGITRIRHNGWSKLDPVAATTEVIAPLLTGLLGMLFLPPAGVWVALRVVPTSVNGKLLYLYVYPAIFLLTALATLLKSLLGVFSSWAQSIRDSEFLVEMRLRNLDSQVEQTETGAVD